MSSNYAEALSPYENKGEVGMPEFMDKPQVFEEKCQKLAKMIKEAEHVMVITGAGISTSAGIPDFRGPNGVWTKEKQGKKVESIDFCLAKPTFTHNALRILEEKGLISWLVSQNVDGLHTQSGFPLNKLAELHGNVYAEECPNCKRRFYRADPVGTFCLNPTGRICGAAKVVGRGRCRGALKDMVLDWDHSLPEPDREISAAWAKCASLSLCLGTSLQIIPVGDFPVHTQRNGGKAVTVNLQKTKHERKVDLAIHSKVDDVMKRVLELLEIPYVKKEEEIGEVVIESINPVIDPIAMLQEKLKKIEEEKKARKRENGERINPVNDPIAMLREKLNKMEEEKKQRQRVNRNRKILEAMVVAKKMKKKREKYYEKVEKEQKREMQKQQRAEREAARELRRSVSAEKEMAREMKKEESAEKETVAKMTNGGAGEKAMKVEEDTVVLH